MSDDDDPQMRFAVAMLRSVVACGTTLFLTLAIASRYEGDVAGYWDATKGLAAMWAVYGAFGLACWLARRWRDRAITRLMSDEAPETPERTAP